MVVPALRQPPASHGGQVAAMARAQKPRLGRKTDLSVDAGSYLLAGTLGKQLNSLSLSFLICKRGIITTCSHALARSGK